MSRVPQPQPDTLGILRRAAEREVSPAPVPPTLATIESIKQAALDYGGAMARLAHAGGFGSPRGADEALAAIMQQVRQLVEQEREAAVRAHTSAIAEAEGLIAEVHALTVPLPKLARSKEAWLRSADSEGDFDITAGIPDSADAQREHHREARE